MRTTLIAILLLTLGAAVTLAGDKTLEAVCRACEVRGSAHGAETVVASREYEGASYHFCSEPCAEAFDAFPIAYAVHPLPRPAPSVRVTTTQGEEINLGSAGGNAILLDFWATWCGPCLKAMPELEQLHAQYGAKGLTVLGVSIDDEAGVAERFLKKKSLAYLVALDSKEDPAWYAFAVAAIPAMYLVDGEGQIVAEWKGKVEMDDVRRKVEALLAENSAD